MSKPSAGKVPKTGLAEPRCPCRPTSVQQPGRLPGSRFGVSGLGEFLEEGPLFGDPTNLWGFPKIRGTISRVPVVEIMAVLGLLGYVRGSYFGKLPYADYRVIMRIPTKDSAGLIRAVSNRTSYIKVTCILGL